MNTQQVLDWLRTRGPHAAAEIAFNFVLPYVVYSATKESWGDVGGLLLSSVPPILWSLAELARHRRIDALSVIVLAGIALSVLAAFGGGGAKMLQLREKLVTAVIGLVFLGSAAIGRPLVYVLAQATMARRAETDQLARLEELKHDREFKRTMTVMTLVWGFGLVADVAVGVALVFSLSIEDYLIVGPIVGYATMGLLAAWTFWYARRQKD